MIASVATGNPIPLLLSVSGKAEDVGNGIKSVADAMQSIRDDYLRMKKAMMRTASSIMLENSEKNSKKLLGMTVLKTLLF